MATDTLVTEDQLIRLAPADRPAGHRGLRGRVAATAALLSLVALSTSAWHGRGGGSGTYGESGTFEYSVDGWRGWAPLVFAILAGALVLAAGILWKSRSRRGVALGSAIAAAAVALGVWASNVGQTFSTVSAVSFKTAKGGTSETELQARLGVPLSTDASATLSSGVTINCDLYRALPSSGQGGFLFCYRDGVLAAKLATGAPL